MGREQGENAARVVACGAGEGLSADASVDQIREAVRLMLESPGYRDASARMATIIARQDGLATAVAEVERL